MFCVSGFGLFLYLIDVDLMENYVESGEVALLEFSSVIDFSLCNKTTVIIDFGHITAQN